MPPPDTLRASWKLLGVANDHEPRRGRIGCKWVWTLPVRHGHRVRCSRHSALPCTLRPRRLDAARPTGAHWYRINFVVVRALIAFLIHALFDLSADLTDRAEPGCKSPARALAARPVLCSGVPMHRRGLIGWPTGASTCWVSAERAASTIGAGSGRLVNMGMLAVIVLLITVVLYQWFESARPTPRSMPNAARGRGAAAAAAGARSSRTSCSTRWPTS